MSLQPSPQMSLQPSPQISPQTPLCFPPPSETIHSVGGLQLHAQVCGPKGPVTVVLEAGLGGFSLHWLMVAKQLCKQARVMVYDRAGYGFSSPAPAAVPRTSEQLAHELHQLLGCLDLAPPYLLVGHSFGGFVVRCFANHYPTEVAAVLLVDAVHEDEWTTQFPLGYRLADRSLAGALAGLAQLARWRMLSWLEPFLPGNSSKLPDQYQRLASQLMLQTHSLETAQRELADMPISAVQARGATQPKQL